MKKILFFLCVCIVSHTYAQHFTPTSAQESLLDEHGNVANNDTDKSGMKQGDWFYVDINGNRIGKKVYTNDQCNATYVFINDQWINCDNLSVETKFNKSVKAKLKANGYVLNNDRQVLIILGKSGEFISGSLLGKWGKDDETKVLSIVKSHLANENISSSNKLIILL